MRSDDGANGMMRAATTNAAAPADHRKFVPLMYAPPEPNPSLKTCGSFLNHPAAIPRKRQCRLMCVPPEINRERVAGARRHSNSEVWGVDGNRAIANDNAGGTVFCVCPGL